MGSTTVSPSDGHTRIIHTVTVTSWVVMTVCVAWCILAAATQQWVMLWIAAFVLGFTALSLLLVRNGHDLIGRLLWYICGILGVTAGVFIAHPEGHVATLYVALLGGPFLTFSIHRERVYLVAMVIGVFVVWGATRVMGHDYFGPPVLDADFSRDYVSLFAVGTTFLVVTFEMGVFAFLMTRYIDDLRASREVADEANRAKSEFLAAMSHEIRTPMNGVVSMVEILENTELTADQRRILHTVQESSDSLLRIIEDILDMSRIEAGKLDLVEEPADLLHIVEAAVDTLRSYADSQNVYVSLHYDLTLPQQVTCDAGRLRQVLLNLLGNAIKFSRRPPTLPGGDVRLSVQRDGADQLHVTVTDNGIGMSAATQINLFEPFRQSEDVASRRFGGSGLGLSIVHQLVTKMRGSVSVHSTPGAGTEFTVHLPMSHPQGALDLPDCKDATFFVYRPGDWQRDVWDRYAAACGGQLEVLGNRDELWAMGVAASGRAVFIIDMKLDSRAEQKAMLDDFCAAFPAARTLLLCRDRGAPTGLLANGAVAVQAAPLLPTDLWTALRELCQLQPGKVVGNTLIEAAVVPARPLRILVAEDNEINQIVIQRQIEQLGHVADIVSHGRAALREWRAGGCDIVLTDCQMPEMDGFALTREIRAAESVLANAKATPIIAITANALEGEAERCLAAGMDGYLAKPVKLCELQAMIDKLTGKAAQNVTDHGDVG